MRFEKIAGANYFGRQLFKLQGNVERISPTTSKGRKVFLGGGRTPCKRERFLPLRVYDTWGCGSRECVSLNGELHACPEPLLIDLSRLNGECSKSHKGNRVSYGCCIFCKGGGDQKEVIHSRSDQSASSWEYLWRRDLQNRNPSCERILGPPK